MSMEISLEPTAIWQRASNVHVEKQAKVATEDTVDGLPQLISLFLSLSTLIDDSK